MEAKMMGKFKFKSFFSFFFFLSFVINSHAASRTVSFDDIRSEGGFGSESLLTVSYIEASGNMMTEEEKEALVNSPYLKNVKALDLKQQRLDDSFIEKLCNNQSLNRLIKLDISENKDITEKSIQLILDSDLLGSVRDLPQISGRYGIPSSTIYVTAKNTSVQGIEVKRFGFHIEYKHPMTGQQTNTPADYAVKFVECSR